MDFFNLDLHRIFFGENGSHLIVEILFRTIFLYVYALIITRFVGRRRNLSQLTTLEFILVIVLGPAVGEGMISPEIPLINSVVVITTAALVARLGAVLAHRNQWVHKFVGGEPIQIIKDGNILTEEIKKENITEEDIKRELRESGHKSEKNIEEGYLEPTGKTSFFVKEK